MKRLAWLILAAVLCLPLVACQGEDMTDQVFILPEGYTLAAESTKNAHSLSGISVEIDPHFFSQNVTRGVVKQEDWDIVRSRVIKMGIDKFRVMIMPSWLEPLNDNDDASVLNKAALTPDSAEMHSLYKVLDLAEEAGIEVNLTLWGAEKTVNLIDQEMSAQVNAAGGHFMSQGNFGSNWIIGTLKPEEFAENFSAYLDLLINQKGYTCITEITPINEPCWSYQTKGSSLGSFEDYAALCRAIHQRLTDDGLRDKVMLNLSDNTDTRRYWLESTVMELDEIADMYNSHTYIFGYQTPNQTIYEWEQQNLNLTRSTGKPHVVGEFGSNQTTGSTRQADIDSYQRGVLMTRQMLNFFNAGAAGASYWVLYDQYYGYREAYAQMMQLGLWKTAKEEYAHDMDYYRTIQEDYEVRPQYYAFALVTKHTQKGADIYPLETGDAFAAGTMFQNPNGKRVYVLANGNQSGTLNLALKSPSANAKFGVYVYSEGNLPQGDALISESAEQRTQNGALTVDLAAQTVVVLVEK